MAEAIVLGGVDLLRQHFGFNQWATAHILQHAAKLSDAELMAPDQTTQGSAFQLLLHTADSEWGWRIICEEGKMMPMWWEVEAIPDLATLTTIWHAEQVRVQEYLATLSDAELSRKIDYGVIHGRASKQTTLASLLAHILYHSATHRSELAVYLTQCGHSPGDVEFLNYVGDTDT